MPRDVFPQPLSSSCLFSNEGAIGSFGSGGPFKLIHSLSNGIVVCEELKTRRERRGERKNRENWWETRIWDISPKVHLGLSRGCDWRGAWENDTRPKESSYTYTTTTNTARRESKKRKRRKKKNRKSKRVALLLRFLLGRAAIIIIIIIILPEFQKGNENKQPQKERKGK